ncbi:hypothetical protein GCM10009609_13890 [Pseudonocardia aurantiaca]
MLHIKQLPILATWLLAALLTGCSGPDPQSYEINATSTATTPGTTSTAPPTATTGIGSTPSAGLTPRPPIPEQTPPSGPATDGIEFTFQFDDLGAASPIILVYPGVTDSKPDRDADGTFNSGDRVPALCKISGRLVKSNTAAGERPYESSIWVRIDTPSDRRQYASLTYGNVTPDIDDLNNC